ncbi:MAG: hypothetical protein DVB22_002634 [Verrucomicrobia bacterium]|jgi:hypothetical protein|nr:MAG: hypothetical protein DVB22_002634 [Verrucomicrobiota bacterium]
MKLPLTLFTALLVPLAGAPFGLAAQTAGPAPETNASALDMVEPQMKAIHHRSGATAGTPERARPRGQRRSGPSDQAFHHPTDRVPPARHRWRRGDGRVDDQTAITEGLVDRLIALGKRFDCFVYPHRDHGLREGKGSELHVRMLIVRYLTEHLPAGPR